MNNNLKDRMQSEQDCMVVIKKATKDTKPTYTETIIDDESEEKPIEKSEENDISKRIEKWL